MARTAVPYSAWVAGGNLADPAGTNLDVSNDMVINRAQPERTLLRVTNTHGSPHDITVKATAAFTPTVPDGDLVVTVAATSGVQWLGPFESARFMQADGTMHVDVEASHAGTITAFLVPKGV